MRTVYVGRPDQIRREDSELKINEAIERNMADAMNIAPEQEFADIADAIRTVDGSAPLKGTRYTFGYGVEVKHGSNLLDTVQVLGLRDALNKIEREQKEGCDSIEVSMLAYGELPRDLVFGKKDWADYGFVIIEDLEWGPLMLSTRELPPAVQTAHRITPNRIAELLTLTTNAQIGLQGGALTTLGSVEQRLLIGILDTRCQFGIQLPSEASFGLTRPSEKEIYEWHIRVNKWEQKFEWAENNLGTLVSEATKGHLAWKRHDDEKEIMTLGRCLESMWAPGERHKKRSKIRSGCQKWMAERHQSQDEIEAVIELLDRFFDDIRNPQAHESTGQPLRTNIERAHLNARIRGIIEDYLWWNLTREWTRSRPRIISRGEEGNTHTMLWSQMCGPIGKTEGFQLRKSCGSGIRGIRQLTMGFVSTASAD